MDKEKLAKRYRSLWLGELVSSILFIALFLYFAMRDGQWSRWVSRGYSLAIVVFILLQGTLGLMRVDTFGTSDFARSEPEEKQTQ